MTEETEGGALPPDRGGELRVILLSVGNAICAGDTTKVVSSGVGGIGIADGVISPPPGLMPLPPEEAA
jgi:hypothetical protein